MRRRWPSVLKVGSTRLGPRKLIDLLSKAVEAEVHHSGDITLVIIRGRYTYTVRERAAVPEDAIAVIADEVVARELEYLINDSATAVERPLVIRPLVEEQASADGLSYDVKDRVPLPLPEQAGTEELWDVRRVDRELIQPSEPLIEVVTVEQTNRVRPVLSEAYDGGIDAITYTTVPLVASEFGEQASSSDAFNLDVKAVVRLDFDETASISESYATHVAELITSTVSEAVLDEPGVAEAQAEVLRFDERQWSDDIPAGYVPQGEETLVIRAFADSVYASDRLLYQKGALSTLAEEQASVDSISIEIEQAAPPFGTVVRSAPAPANDPNAGIGGDPSVIWYGAYDKVFELSPADFSVVRSGNVPNQAVAASGIGGDPSVIWICDGFVDKIFELSPADFSMVRSGNTPGGTPTGIGGDPSVIWHCDGSTNNGKVFELSTSDFSVVKSAGAPYVGPLGIGGKNNVVWHCDWIADKIYELSTTDFSVVRSASSPGSNPRGIGGDSSVIWHYDMDASKVYELGTG